MGKDKSLKVEKKQKKEKRSATDGIKKSKKDKKSKLTSDNIAAAFEVVTAETAGSTQSIPIPAPAPHESAEIETFIPLKIAGNLVPFANPLADEKITKKVLKSVKKAAKNKTLKRGVKEVVKALRKSPQGVGVTGASGVVILAADISPMDVISHIPVLCEDHSVPYIFVSSRAELGSAGNTKRPTSVVMVSEARVGSKKAEKVEGDEEFKDVYKQLVTLVEKEARNVRV